MNRARTAWFAVLGVVALAGILATPFEEVRDVMLSRYGAILAGGYTLSVAVTLVCTVLLAAIVGFGWRTFAKEFRHLPELEHNDPLREAVVYAMRYRLFWVVIWVQTATVVFNNLLPLTVLGEMPTSSVLATFAILLTDDLLVIAFRIWLIRLHRETSVVAA